MTDAVLNLVLNRRIKDKNERMLLSSINIIFEEKNRCMRSLKIPKKGHSRKNGMSNFILSQYIIQDASKKNYQQIFKQTYFDDPSYGIEPCRGPSCPWCDGGGYPPRCVALE